MFLNNPNLKFVGAYRVKLSEDLRYYSPSLNVTISVPLGLESDLASIPLFFQRVFPVNDLHKLPSILHDFLYGINGGIRGYRKLSRKECDLIYLEAMKFSGVPRWKRQSMYLAVRVGGWSRWNVKAGTV